MMPFSSASLCVWWSRSDCEQLLWHLCEFLSSLILESLRSLLPCYDAGDTLIFRFISLKQDSHSWLLWWRHRALPLHDVTTVSWLLTVVFLPPVTRVVFLFSPAALPSSLREEAAIHSKSPGWPESIKWDEWRHCIEQLNLHSITTTWRHEGDEWRHAFLSLLFVRCCVRGGCKFNARKSGIASGVWVVESWTAASVASFWWKHFSFESLVVLTPSALTTTIDFNANSSIIYCILSIVSYFDYCCFVFSFHCYWTV